MSRVAERVGISAAEFLAWERQQPTRHEFFLGQVFAMAGGSPRHNALCVAVGAALHAAFRGGRCRVLSSDQRLGLGDGERYVYPDLTAVCGTFLAQTGTTDVLINPTIVVEVLSLSTEQYDRGLKWDSYQRIASLSDYLLVSQDTVRIEQFRREPDGSWRYRSFGPGERVVLSNGTALDLGQIFEGVFELAAG